MGRKSRGGCLCKGDYSLSGSSLSYDDTVLWGGSGVKSFLKYYLGTADIGLHEACMYGLCFGEGMHSSPCQGSGLCLHCLLSPSINQAVANSALQLSVICWLLDHGGVHLLECVRTQAHVDCLLWSVVYSSGTGSWHWCQQGGWACKCLIDSLIDYLLWSMVIWSPVVFVLCEPP